MTDPETIPICKFCPQHRSAADEPARIELRNWAVNLQYNSWPVVEPGEISGVLQKEFDVDRDTADFAVECLGKIIRRYCPRCDIAMSEAGIKLVQRPTRA